MSQWLRLNPARSLRRPALSVRPRVVNARDVLFAPRCPWTVVLLYLIAAGLSSARAELVYFEKGGRAQVAATVDGKSVRIEGPDGVVAFDASDFARVVPGYWPEREWPDRLRSALKGDAFTRFAAFRWALDEGLTDEAVALALRAHHDDPQHAGFTRVASVLERLAKPLGDPDLKPLEALLGTSAKVARGSHVVLIHQHDDADATARVRVLEQVVTTFYARFAALGIELRAPEHRLASVWFATQKSYLDCLKLQHGDAFLTTRGYYLPALDAVLAFDTRGTESYRESAAILKERERETAGLSAAIARMPANARLKLTFPDAPPRALRKTEARAVLSKFERDVARQKLLLDLDRLSLDLAIAAHEQVHQLIAHSGLVVTHASFPIWLHEGLAMQYEHVRGGRWGGVSHPHERRLAAWRALDPQPALPPLLRDVGFGRGYRQGPYASAWALVYDIERNRPDDFLTFLDLLRAPRVVDQPRERDARVSNAFRGAFGDDLIAFQEGWRKRTRELKTPLEVHDPRPPGQRRLGQPADNRD